MSGKGQSDILVPRAWNHSCPRKDKATFQFSEPWVTHAPKTQSDISVPRAQGHLCQKKQSDNSAPRVQGYLCQKKQSDIADPEARDHPITVNLVKRGKLVKQANQANLENR